MTWYRLNLPIDASELDARLDQYRDVVQQAIARIGARDLVARIYCTRDPRGGAEIFLDLEGRQPGWMLLKMMRCERLGGPPSEPLELLGEVVDGAASVSAPFRPA
jgi:hypothetical protein